MAQYAYAKPPPYYYQTFDRQSLQFTKFPVIKQTSSIPTESEPSAEGDPEKPSEEPGKQAENAEPVAGDEPTTGSPLSSFYISIRTVLRVLRRCGSGAECFG